MARTSGGFRAGLLIGWTALCVAGILYARSKNIPSWAALPALAAFLIEYPFYLVPAFPEARERVAGGALPGFLVASAVLPYLACCLGAVPFQFLSLVKLAALALALGLWYRVFPRHPLTDIAFLGTVVAVKLGRYTAGVYPVPFRGIEIGVLGDLALFQIAVLVLMLERRVPETGYGLWPTVKDWRIGVLHFLYFAPLGLALGLGLRAVHFARTTDPLRLALYFLGWLTVLALAEEFFFRGVLQGWLEEWMRSPAAALVATSIAFGAVHLWFRQFPNWKWVAIAGTLGWFCGRARNRAGSIRAGMVTHTLAIVAWRAFFA
ncbi:MAG TPA: CPBP family intramembrane glutamic endopeptidase [Candidatus Acidoferrales bacterium]|nr:CPBP family intramembrane glutamic endopeptidase [Candidatus Acidoferrales bacterium]